MRDDRPVHLSARRKAVQPLHGALHVLFVSGSVPMTAVLNSLDAAENARGSAGHWVVIEIEGYSVSVLPPDHPDWNVFVIRLERVRPGEDSWAVRQMGRCMSRTYEWEHEPIPSERTDGWLQSHRFTEKEARSVATGYAGLVEWNGLRAIDLATKP